MKRNLTIWLILLCVCSFAAADRVTLDPTKTQVALPMPVAPIIDGIIENAEWQMAGGSRPGGAEAYWRMVVDENAEDFVRGGDITAGVGPWGPEDFGAQIYVGYDSKYIYVAVRVTDDEIWDDSAAANSQNGETWQDDSVEIFFDGDNSNFATRDTTGTNPEVVGSGGQFVITTNNAYREAEAGNPGYGPDKAWYALTDFSNNGYMAEFRVSLATLGNPKPGDIIGFTVTVNDDDDGDVLENQYTWCGKTHEEITYGNLILGPRTYNAPVATPTIDGKITAGEYGTAAEMLVNKFTGVYNLLSGDDVWEEGDQAFKAWVVHDTQAVYIGLDVTDDAVVTDTAAAGSEDGNTWEDDAIEVFIDANFTKTSGRDSTILYEGQFVLTPNGAHRDAEANNPTWGENADWFAKTTQTATGYQMEFKIKKATILNPANNSIVGFDICLDDDDGAGRKTQLSWAGDAHNEATYGELKLSVTTPITEWSLF